MTISLSAYSHLGFMRAEVTTPDGTKRELRSDLLPRDFFQRLRDTNARLQPFDYRAKAREVARAMADQLTEEVFAMLQEAHPVRNPATFARWSQDMRTLFAALVHQARLSDAERKHLRRLCALLELDLPSNHRQADKNSA